jgi:hypothetical protein
MKTGKQDILGKETYTVVNRALKSLKNVKETLQQLKYRPALRIPYREDAALADPLARAVLEQLRLISTEFARLCEESAKPGGKAKHEPLQFYADLGTGVWRLWKKMLRPGSDKPLDEMRSIFGFVESLRDALQEGGIQIIDHTGKEIPSGLSLEVLEYQEKPGVTKERVSETVRPTIYYKDRMIQMGRVYVDAPMASRGSARKV